MNMLIKMQNSRLNFRLISLYVVLITNVYGTERLNYVIREEEEVGTIVGNILSDSSLSQNYSSDITRTLEFDILSKDRIPVYFDLQRSTGVLKIRSRLDREEACPRKTDCILIVDVAVGPAAYFRLIKVHVTVEDLNDFVPRFDIEMVERTLVESATPGILFPILPARDLDSPRFGTIAYELRGGLGQFRLEITEHDGGNSDIRLVLVEQLDRETIDEYHLQIFAYDNGDPPLIGSQTIHLIITDVNDHVPSFVQNTYEIDACEDLVVRSQIGAVRATDSDEGRNSHLTYAFETKTERLYGDTFHVDRSNGTILLSRKLDYEYQSLYSLKVNVHDAGAIQLTATAIVIVHVIDVNDNAPVLKVDDEPIEQSVTVYLHENQPNDTYAAIISVTDEDQGMNAYVDCSLRQEQRMSSSRTGTGMINQWGFFRMFKFMENEYQVVTTRPLDRELESEHYIQVSCSDRGNPPLSSFVHIVIRVRDENDNDPVFANDHYVFNINENNPINAFIGQVKASDADMGGNGKVSFQFCTENADGQAPWEILALDERTGVLTAQEHLDYESGNILSACIKAFDNGFVSRTSTTIVHITINDVNDNEPKFNHTSYNFTVYENMAEGTHAGRLDAYDLDSPPLNLFLFIIDKNPHFVIDLNDGLITTLSRLDREEKATHTLTAYVRSHDYPQMSDVAIVTINVLDVNDNPPVILSPLPNTILPPISPHVPVGYNVTQIIANDADKDKNGLLNYTLDEIKIGYFTIDPSTGMLSTIQDLRHIVDVESFKLRVTVRDNGFIPRDTATAFTVVVNASVSFGSNPVASQATLFREEMRVVLIASVAALFLVFVILLTVCVVFVRSKKQQDTSKDSNFWSDKQRYATNHNGIRHDDLSGSEEEKMALRSGKEDDDPPLRLTNTYTEFTEPSPDGYSNGTGTSRQPVNGAHRPNCQSNGLYHTLTSGSSYNSSPHRGEPPRHVTFKDQRNSLTVYNVPNGTVIGNPSILMDGSEGTFV